MQAEVNSTSPCKNNDIDVIPKQEPTVAAADHEGEKMKLPIRNPRWTIKDTVTLIQAKQVVEDRSSNYQMGSVVFGPKWDFVSLFCKQCGVERGPVQCRKRWGNLVCDFRKIKTWESQVKEESTESFWEMRSDLRKEKKLPGYFDREIYNLLDGGRFAATAYPLRSVKEFDPKDGYENNENEQIINQHDQSVVENKMLMIKELVTAGANSATEEPASPNYPVPTPAKTKENNPNSGDEPVSREGKKRKCTTSNEYEETSLKKLLIEVLEKNFTMVNEQLEAQNLNTQLDREQKKDQNGDLISALTKIADALGRIAGKL